MNNRTAVGVAVLTMLVSWVPSAQASTTYGISPKQNESKFQRPEDLLDMIPFLGQLPKSFLVGDGFKMKLTTTELRIDHMGPRSHSPAHRRNCMLGLSYTTPVAGFFTSRVDIPLMSADTPAVSDWTRSSFGDYVVFLSRTPADKAALRLVATARF